jgi:hypothetical protein
VASGESPSFLLLSLACTEQPRLTTPEPRFTDVPVGMRLSCRTLSVLLSWQSSFWWQFWLVIEVSGLYRCLCHVLPLASGQSWGVCTDASAMCCLMPQDRAGVSGQVTQPCAASCVRTGLGCLYRCLCHVLPHASGQGWGVWTGDTAMCCLLHQDRAGVSVKMLLPCAASCLRTGLGRLYR